MKQVGSIIIILLCSNIGNDLFPVSKEISGNTTVESFRRAKKLIKGIYEPRQLTFYCNCPFENSRIILNQCDYEPLRNSERAGRLEWEHIVPAYVFGRKFSAWRKGHPRCVKGEGEHRKRYRGRKCLRKVSKEFKRMEADLYNLVPAIGELNGIRSNYPMAMIPKEVRMFGQCDVEISDHRIEPRPEVRGDIARIYFYMAAAYPKRVRLNRREQKLFRKWSREDPVDEWEFIRVQKIEEIQGNPNPFVLNHFH